MKKIILIPVFLGAIVIAGCQLTTTPVENSANNVMTGSQNTGTQTTGNTQQPQNQTSYHFQLNGTEPFWGGNISGNNLTISMPDDNAENKIFTTILPVSNTGNTETIVFINVDENTVVTLQKGSCNDGMGPTQYDYKAVMIRSGTTYQGCALTK